MYAANQQPMLYAMHAARHQLLLYAMYAAQQQDKTEAVSHVLV